VQSWVRAQLDVGLQGLDLHLGGVEGDHHAVDQQVARLLQQLLEVELLFLQEL